MMQAIIFSFVGFLGLSPLPRPAFTLDQVFAKLNEVAKTFRSIEVDLEITHVIVIVNDKNVSSGKLYYSRAGKDFRLKVALGKPAEQSVLIDKGKATRYTPKINQADESSLGNKANLVEQYMSLGFGQSSEELKRNYQVSLAGEETIDDKRTAVLDLTPTVAGGPMKSVRLWFDEQKGVAAQIKVTETGGDYIIYKYSNIKLNSTLPGSTFEINMPKDVHINKF
jgi:outer membrane lipoprotein-sorting protein